MTDIRIPEDYSNAIRASGSGSRPDDFQKEH